MTKKVLILLLAMSMVCSSLFAAFALDNASANKGDEQSSNTIGEENEKGEDNAHIAENEKEEGITSIPAYDNSSSVELEESKNIQPTPVQSENPNTEKNYNGKVTFVNQWVKDSSERINTEKEFTSPNEKIGKPAYNSGLLRGLAKIFLAWSDKPPVDNGHLAPGARYFSPEDTIDKAFPEGIPEDAKLYGVYFSLVGDDEPFPGGKLPLLQIGNLAHKFSDLINETRVEINASMSAGDTRPDTGVGKGNYEDNVDGNVRTILDHYKYDVNNIVNLTSEFYMDPTIALITYRNPIASNQLKPILSRDYDQRKKDGNFPIEHGKKAGYTYVDLNISLDKDFEIPDVFYLEFFGYSWRPLYVMDENNHLLEILNPDDNTSLGSDTHSFDTLVDNKNPKVRFGVKTNKSNKITVRVILRESEMEKILEENITPDQGKTIMETILSNMTLKCLPKTNLRIADEKARELAKSNGEETLLVNGTVNGHMFVSAGIAQMGKIKFNLASDTEIKETKSNDLKLGYVPNNVYYKFVSGTKGKALPDVIIAKLPKNRLIKNKDGVLDQDKVDLSTYDDVKVSDGVWTFQSWYVTNDKFENDPNLKAVSKETVLNSPDDLHLLGVWVFKADTDDVEKPKQNEKTPRTADNQSIALILSTTLVSLASLAMLQRRNNVK
ncbi:MAG: SHIRT domain-containing protein [Christensenellales bacterium]